MLQDEYALVAAIHIGVSSTVCCYSFVRKEAHIETIKNWPKQSIQETALPTIISYSDSFKTFASFGNAEQSSNVTVVKDLPYLLINCHPWNNFESLKNDEKHKYIDEKNSIKIVADYIKAVNAHILKRLHLLKDKNIDPIRYCFTLQFSKKTNTSQMTTSTYEQNLMEAIKLAGIYTEGKDREDKIEFIDAYTSMSKYFLKSRDDFTTNDEFIICDSDATYLIIKSMKIFSVGRDIDVEEGQINEFEGDLGGRKIDERFGTYVVGILKAHPDYKEAGDEQLSRITSAAVDFFIKNIKYTLSLASKQEIFVKVSSSSTQSHTPSFIQLNVDDLKTKVFDPITDRIFERIDIAYEKHPVKYIFLCGRLSKSLYLQQRIQKKYKNLIVTSDEQAPAARGAVYHGLNEKLAIQRYAPISLSDKIEVGEDRSYYDFSYDVYTHVIGIDFGTNYSKWCIYSRKEQNYVNFENDEVICSTLALFDDRFQKQKYWGDEAFDKYYIHPGEPGKLFNRFKLFLDETRKGDLDEKTAITVISSYLEALNNHILITMEKKQPNEKREYRYCLTVPIIWDDKLKKSMREAAISAKLISRANHPSRLMLVSEPEAAAAFYSESIVFEKFKGEKARVIICDAGGGTVDIATYEYSKMKEGYSISEVTPSSGDICGSSFLEDNYRKLFNKKIHDKNYNLTRYDTEVIIKNFAFGIKRDFSKNTHVFSIDVPVVTKDGVKTEKIEIKNEEMKNQVFEPVVTKVIALIKKQREMSRGVDLVILTGGFGQSAYLKEKLDELSHEFKFEVYQPTHYDLSVVKGAVKVAENPNIIHQRVAQQTYGIEVLVPYSSNIHSLVNQVKLYNGVYAQLEFDKLIDISTYVPLYRYHEKTYKIEYPHNTYIALHGTSAQKTSSNSTLHPDIKELVRYLIETPKLNSVKDGQLITLKLRIFFGQTEIKIDSSIEDNPVQRVSFPYTEEDENRRLEGEKAHHKK